MGAEASKALVKWVQGLVKSSQGHKKKWSKGCILTF